MNGVTDAGGNKAPQEIDLVIVPRWVVPIFPAGCFASYAVAIHQGKILEVAPVAQIKSNYVAKEEKCLPDHLLMPGLINAHGHSAMSLMRGIADDRSLMDWLQKYIWPIEAKLLSPDMVALGTELAIAEMIQTGTTCYSDMYFFPEIAAQVATQVGIRTQLAITVIDFPTPWAKGAGECLSHFKRLCSEYINHPTVYLAVGPHAPYSVSDASFEQVLAMSEEFHRPIHIHLHESVDEITSSLRDYQMRPIRRMQKLGILKNTTQCVHMVHLDEEDLLIIQEKQSKIIHCPKSNLKLASGFSPIKKIIEKGICFGIGTDGPASNNSLDLFEELRFASLLTKAVSADPQIFPAQQALEAVTLTGAKVLGLEDRLGSLEPGKEADCIAIHFSTIDKTPCYDPISQLVYTNSGLGVDCVWCAGKLLLEKGILKTIDSQKLIAHVADFQERMGDYQV